MKDGEKLKYLIGHKIINISRLVPTLELDIEFRTISGMELQLVWSRDCCEDVVIDEILGDINDILYSEIIEIIIETSNPSFSLLLPETKPKNDKTKIKFRYYTIVSKKGQITFRVKAQYSCGSFRTKVNIINLRR